MATIPEAATLPAELVSLTTDDGWQLDALHHPADSRVALLHLHGKGANMLGIQSRFLPALLPDVAQLSLNMRCHDLAYNTDRADRPVAGGMYERLDDGAVDIAAGLAFLRERYEFVVLCGHSSGGYYAGAYGHTGDTVDGRILLSPLFDNKTALSWWWPDPADLESAIERAGAMVAAGRGAELIPLPSWYWGISADSLVERAAQPSDRWITGVENDPSPVLMLWGDTEGRDDEWARYLAGLAVPVTGGALVGSDHWYGGFEHDIADRVRTFLEPFRAVST